MSAVSLLVTLFTAHCSLISGVRTHKKKKAHHGMTHSVAFHAAGLSNSTAALEFLDSLPEDGGCMPVCTWKCNTPTCNQVCEPKCDAPKCESRCKMDTSKCKFACGEPSCAVVCPEGGCAQEQPCPKCKALCGKPVCGLECPGSQPCTTVCEEPACKYECRKPDDCPQPQCSMVCETPKTCQDFQVAKELPPASAGETVVESFNANQKPLHPVAAGNDMVNALQCPPGCVSQLQLRSISSRNFLKHRVSQPPLPPQSQLHGLPMPPPLEVPQPLQQVPAVSAANDLPPPMSEANTSNASVPEGNAWPTLNKHRNPNPVPGHGYYVTKEQIYCPPGCAKEL